MIARRAAWRYAAARFTPLLLCALIAWLIAAPLIALLVRAIAETGSLDELLSPFGPGFVHRLRNTLLIAGGTTLTALLIGVALAVTLAQDRCLPGRRLFYLLAFLPFWIPTYVVSIVAIEALGRHGVVARALMSVGLIREFPSFIYSPLGVIIVMTFSLMPFVVLPVALALRAQDRELLEAARLEAASRQIWWRLRLPLAAPAIVTSALLVFFFSAVEFAAPEQLQVSTGVVEVFVQFQALLSAFGAMSAAAPVAIVCGVLAWVLVRRVPLPEGEPVIVPDDRSPARFSFEPSSINWPGLALCIAFLALPMLWMAGLLALRAGGLDAYHKAFSTSGRELMVSVKWGGAAAAAALALSVALGVRAYSWPRRQVRRLMILMAMALGVPGVLYGCGIVVLYNQPGIPPMRHLLTSPPILLVSHLARALPVALLIVLPMLRGLDRSLWEAARLEGAERGWAGWRLLWGPHFALPLLMLVLLVFVFNLQDLGAPLMVQPPGATPFIVRIFSLIHFGFDREVAALCLILAALCSLSAAIAAVVWMLWRRK